MPKSEEYLQKKMMVNSTRFWKPVVKQMGKFWENVLTKQQ